MGRPRRFESDAARQRAHRLRVSEGVENPLVEPELVQKSEPVVLSAELSGEAQEQAVRDSFGYSRTERRTRAERDAAAARMLGRASSELGEEAYVREALLQTELTAGLIRPLVRGAGDPREMVDKSSSGAVADRLVRAERYARWRFRGVLEGGIGAL